MWVGLIRRCLRHSSTCERWISGVYGGIASWCFACLCGFVWFSGLVVVMVEGLVG